MLSIKQRHNLHIIFLSLLYNRANNISTVLVYVARVSRCMHEVVLIIDNYCTLFIVSESLGVSKHDRGLPLELIIINGLKFSLG